MELTLSVPVPKVPKPAPTFPRHCELHRSLLAVVEQHKVMAAPLCAASQDGSAAPALLPVQWAVMTRQKWDHECLGTSPGSKALPCSPSRCPDGCCVDWAYFLLMQITLVQRGAPAAAAPHQFRYPPPLFSRTSESKRLVATKIYTPSARVNLIWQPLLSQDNLSVCENVP